MKKTILLAAMSVLFIVGLTSMVNMDPPPNTNCNEICDYFEGFGLSHGECMSTCNTCLNPGNGNDAVCFCNFLDAIGILEEAELNFGQCVSYFNSHGQNGNGNGNGN